MVAPIALILAPVCLPAQSLPGNLDCGSLENAYGPYDYTNPTHKRENLPVVERVHFTDNVYTLRSGETGSNPLGDIDYTLRAFPNHHLALDAMARLHLKHDTERLPNGRYSIHCWFQRALEFRPEDAQVHLVYGIYLFRAGELEQARQRLTTALEKMPNSAEAHYNLGLLYVQRGDYDAARESAEKAYELGFPLPGLREQLKRAGEWNP